MTVFASLLALAMQGPAAAGPLPSPDAVPRPIARGERHLEALDLPAGSLVLATARGHDTTIELRLRSAGAPDHEAVGHANQDAAALVWLAEAPARVEIEVRCPGGEPGTFTLATETRPATDDDRSVWAGQSAFQDARRLQGAGRAGLPQANARYRAALAIFEALGDRRRVVEAWLGIAFTHYYNDERTPALDAMKTAVALSRDQGLIEGEALHSLGTLYNYLGELEASLAAFEQALALARTRRAPILEAFSQLGLSVVYNNLGDWAKMLAARQEAAALVQKYGAHPEEEGGLIDKLGQAYTQMGRLDEAEAALTRALALWQSIDHKKGEAATLTSLGTVARRRGAHVRALELFQRSLALKKGTHSRQSESQTETEIASCHRTLGDAAQAVAAYERAYALIRDLKTRHPSQWTIPANLAELERNRGRLEDARRWIDLALTKAELAHAALNNEDLRTTHAARVAWVFALQVDILMRQHQADGGKGLDRAAFEASERGRARTLLEVLQDARLDFAGPRAAPLAAAAPVTVDTLRPLLDRDTVLIEYALGPGRSYLWVLTSDGFSSHVLPDGDEVAQTARALHERWSERSRRTAGEGARSRRLRLDAADREADDLARRLSATLLGPVPDLARYKRLVVVPDGVLHYVPFAALPQPSAEGRGAPLVDRHEVVHLPSAAVAVALRRRSESQRMARTVAVFADPVFTPEDPRVRGPRPAEAAPPRPGPELPRLLSAAEAEPLPRLEYTRRLAGHLLRDVPAEQKLAAFDFAASREAVVAADLEQYRMLLFATHGILDTERPELSGLALSMVDAAGRRQDGFLRLKDIYDLKLAADLVVLGACETGLGKEMRGEGLIGLSRGFLHAGASRVLASLWKVDEQATVALLEELYRGTGAGRRPYPEALREAQRRLARSPRYRSPYFWAGFSLQGDWQ